MVLYASSAILALAKTGARRVCTSCPRHSDTYFHFTGSGRRACFGDQQRLQSYLCCLGGCNYAEDYVRMVRDRLVAPTIAKTANRQSLPEVDAEEIHEVWFPDRSSSWPLQQLYRCVARMCPSVVSCRCCQTRARSVFASGSAEQLSDRPLPIFHPHQCRGG